MLERGFGPHPLSLASTPQTLTVPTNPNCGNWVDDGAQYTTPSGLTFKISCHADHIGGDIFNFMATDFSHCIAACSTYPGCYGVAWVPFRTYANCNFKTASQALPPLTPDSMGPYSEVDVAMLLGAPSCASMSYPQADAQWCQSSTGLVPTIYKISCKTIYATEYLAEVNARTLGACINLCFGQYTGHCNAVDYYVPEYPGANSCLIVSQLGNPSPADDTNGGMSATPLQALFQGYGPVTYQRRDIGQGEVKNIEGRVVFLSTSSVSSSTISANSSMFIFVLYIKTTDANTYQSILNFFREHH